MVTQLNIFRGTTPIASVDIDEKTVMQREFMGADKIAASFILTSALNLAIGDHVIYMGRKYSIKHAPEAHHGKNGYTHAPIFYSEPFSWYDKLLMDEGDSNFSYTGTPFEFLSLILYNVQEFDSAWQIGDVALIDEPQTLPFSGTTCFQALVQVAQAFKLEFNWIGKSVYLVENVGTTLPITLEYGRGKGLYSLTRRAVDEAFATEWYGYGGTQNLPVGYGKTRLSLASPVQRNVSLYGRKQGMVTFDHIYPRYTGNVASISGSNTITDIGINFPITPIADGSAKIVFKTGDLGGNEFTITGWNQSTGIVTFGTNREEGGYELPNDNVHASIGDTYTVVGVLMPNQYMTSALSELSIEVNSHADKNSHPKVAYGLQVDRNYIATMGYTGMINPGDRLRVKDTQLFINDLLRIQSVSWPLVQPGAITATISDSVQYTFQERIAKDAIDGKKIASNAQAGAVFARKVADEIANAAVVTQFQRNYVGDRAILTGAVVVGNPDDGEVGFITGVFEGTGPGGEVVEEDMIIVGGGSKFGDRKNAKFKLLRNGNIYSTAGYIGGFKILQNSLESANDVEGGRFVLSPDGGLIAFMDDPEDVWSGIGVNVFSVASGIRAVARFENKSSKPTTNYAVYASAENGINNISFHGKGNVSVDGAISQRNLYVFTPNSTVNTLSAKQSNNAILRVTNATYNWVYLPTVDDIRGAFGIASSADFCIRYTVSAHYNSLALTLAVPSYDMRDFDGNVMANLAMEKGDSADFYIFSESGTVTAQILNRQHTS